MGPGTRCPRALGRALCLLIGMLTVIPSARAADLPAGEWHLDSLTPVGAGVYATPDSSGNGNDLRTTTVSSLDSGGRWGAAVDLSAGSFSQLTTTSSPAVLAPAHVTVLAWVRAATPPAIGAYVLAFGGDNTCKSPSYALQVSANKGLQFVVTDQGGVRWTTADPGLNAVWDGTWHAVAGVFDGGAIHLYVDGNEVGSPVSGVSGIRYGLATGKLSLGGYPDVNCESHGYLTGSVDEVRVYGRALSAGEVSELQTSSAGAPPELGGTTTTSSATTTTSSSTTTSFSSTTTTGPSGGGGRPPSPAMRLAGVSKTLPGTAWLSAVDSVVAQGRSVVDYIWDPSGTGQDSDPCGPSPVASFGFTRAGLHTVGLTVVDSAGQSTTIRRAVLVSAGMVNAAAAQGTFDCENPAGTGNQPDRADCVKSFGWSLLDINSRGKRDDCFTIDARLNSAALSIHVSQFAPSAAADGHAAFKRSFLDLYHASVPGPVAVNGLYIPVPESVRSQYDTGTGQFGFGAVPIHIGPVDTDRFRIDRTLSLSKFPASDPCYPHGVAEGYHLLDNGLLQAAPTIGGLPFKGGVTIDLQYHTATVIGNLGLPNIFGFAPGKPAQGTVCLRTDNQNGLEFDGVKLAVPNAFIGPVPLSNLSFSYERADDVWQGGATVFLPGANVGLNASPPPPDLGFGLRHGRFDHAGIGIEFGRGLGPELFPGIFVDGIHVALGTQPLRLTGGVTISAGEIIDIKGDVFVAFASPDQTYAFPTTDGDLAPLSGRTLDTLTLAVGGSASARVPFLGGDLPLAHAYLLYEFPDYFELGGNFEFDPPLLKITGQMLGFVDPPARAFDLSGSVSACLRDAIHIKVGPIDQDIKLCFDTAAAVSSKGIGFCGTVPVPAPIVGVIPVTITVGYRWGASLPGFSVFSCDIGDYEVSATRARVRGRAAAAGFTVAHGESAVDLRVTGAGGAPNVVLEGPGGRRIDTSGAPGSRDVAVITVPGSNVTDVGLRAPAAGRWSIVPAAGSPAISGVAVAHGLPPAKPHVVFSGRPPRRTLHLTFRAAPGRTVQLLEVGAGVQRTVLTSSRSTRVLFTPAAGPAGRRRIVAVVRQDRIERQHVTVASFRVGTSRLVRPRGLHAHRSASALRLDWRAVRGTWRYAVTLTLPGGRRTLRLVRRPAITFAGLPASLAVSVQVAALDATTRRGPAATLRVLAPRRRHRAHR